MKTQLMMMVIYFLFDCFFALFFVTSLLIYNLVRLCQIISILLGWRIGMDVHNIYLTQITIFLHAPDFDGKPDQAVHTVK